MVLIKQINPTMYSLKPGTYFVRLIFPNCEVTGVQTPYLALSNFDGECQRETKKKHTHTNTHARTYTNTCIYTHTYTTGFLRFPSKKSTRKALVDPSTRHLPKVPHSGTQHEAMLLRKNASYHKSTSTI